MPHYNTHIAFAKDLLSETDLDEKYFLSGAVFPDFMALVPMGYEDKFTDYLHLPEPKSKTGFIFAEKLLKSAKTREEKSFAYGFLSHFLLDRNVHTYIAEKKLPLIEHLELEYYLAYKDLKHKFRSVKVPLKLIQKSIDDLKLTKAKRELYKEQMKKITFWQRLKYSFIADVLIRHLIKKKYGANPKFSFLLKTGLKSKSKFYKENYDLDIFKLLNPNKSLKKHLPELNKILTKTKREFRNYLNIS